MKNARDHTQQQHQQMDGFTLKVRRKLDVPAPPAPAPVAVAAAPAAAPAAAAPAISTATLDEEDLAERLVSITSPKVLFCALQ